MEKYIEPKIQIISAELSYLAAGTNIEKPQADPTKPKGSGDDVIVMSKGHYIWDEEEDSDSDRMY